MSPPPQPRQPSKKITRKHRRFICASPRFFSNWKGFESARQEIFRERQCELLLNLFLSVHCCFHLFFPVCVSSSSFAGMVSFVLRSVRFVTFLQAMHISADAVCYTRLFSRFQCVSFPRILRSLADRRISRVYRHANRCGVQSNCVSTYVSFWFFFVPCMSPSPDFQENRFLRMSRFSWKHEKCW